MYALKKKEEGGRREEKKQMRKRQRQRETRPGAGATALVSFSSFHLFFIRVALYVIVASRLH